MASTTNNEEGEPSKKPNWFLVVPCVLLTIHAIRKLLHGDFGWRVWIGLILALAIGISELMYLRKPKPKAGMDHSDEEDEENDTPLKALVFLLDEPRTIDDDGPWIKQIGEALGRNFSFNDEEEGGELEFIMPMPHPGITEGTGQCFMLKLKEGMFWILNFRKPYMPDPEKFSQAIVDMRLRTAVAEHKAWLSVDLVTPCVENLSDEVIYDLIGKTLSALVGPDVRAIYSPEHERCNEFDPSLIPMLAGGKPLEIFADATFAPVVRIEDADEQMEAAKDEARRRWPEFVNLFNKREPEGEAPFIVKAPFTDKDHTEFMWVVVQGIEDMLVTGELANTPHQLVGFHEGQTVVIPSDSIVDWLCLDEHGQPIGGWTNKVLAAHSKRGGTNR